MTREATTPALSESGASPQGLEATADGATELCSQVSSAFTELSRVEEELQQRLQEFSEREAEMIAMQEALERERDELDAQTERVERLSRRTAAREEAFRKREEAVGHREEAARSFQTTLTRMAAALDDPTPTNVSAAFEAATAALRDGHAALAATAGNETEAAEPQDEEPTQAAQAPLAEAEEDDCLDLSDFAPEELHRLEMLRQLGTATTGQIAEQIRNERDAKGSPRARKKKKKGGKKHGWLF